MVKIDNDYISQFVGSNEPADLDIDVEDWADPDDQPKGTIKYKLTWPQTNFLSLTCANPLFVGGYGSGKTTTKLISAMRDLTQFKGANIALYDPTFDQIGLNTAPRLIEMLVDLGLEHKYNSQKSTIKVAGHGMFIMRSMNNPERIVGYEVFRSHVDEIGVVNPQKVDDVWNKIVARNRQKIYVLNENNRKIIDIKTKKPLTEQNKISAYGTPDDGFGFTYKMWGKDPAAGYEYVRAPTSSNAANIPDDYIPSLYRIYPSGLVDAFINGIWCNFTSGTIYYGYDRERCSTRYTVAEREQLHIGMDFNVYHMAASICVLRKGILYLVDELIDLRDTPDMIKTLHNLYPDHNIIIYPDSAGADSSHSTHDVTKTDHKLLRDAGFKVKARAANPLIRDRLASVNSAFENGKVFINEETAPQHAESVEQHTYDANGKPEKKSGLDHRNDSLGYIIHWFFALRRPKVSTIGVQTI